MPTDPQRIQELFLVAADIPDPAERDRFLADACDGEPAVRARVEALLRAHGQPDSLLDRPAVELPRPTVPTGRPAAVEGDGPFDPADDVPLGFLAPATRPGSLGRIGHYEVLQVLGRGGFGIVFRAFDDVLQRVVAVKLLSPHLAATSPARKRFLREARSSAAVRHENVVQVYEVWEGPLPFIVMEFIPGETLQQRLDRSGPLDVPAVLRVGRQIAEGLAAAHVTGLIHRDIKPGNILLEGGTQKVKITDFGLARAADDASLTHSGVIAGTPMYMAPEQAKGETLDERADLFSLGSVLYQMTAGRPPFRATGTLAVLKRVAEDRPRPIREIIPETPPWLCDIITTLHAKNPAERFQTAREVADVLADCEAQLKASGRVKTLDRPKPAPAGPGAKLGRWPWAAAVLLLAVSALLSAEVAGFTHLFRRPVAATGPDPVGPVSLPPGPASLPPDPVPPPPPTPAAPAADPDRRAADYVLHIGGAVRVRGWGEDIKVAADLPPGPIRLTVVLLNQNPRLTDAGLVNLKGCKHLTRLELGCKDITDAGLATLPDCTSLTWLNLHDNERVGDAGLAHLKGCPNLTHLFLCNVRNVGDTGLVHVKGLNRLESLLLYGTQVTDAGLAHLAGLDQLTRLDLHDTKVTAKGAEELAKALPGCKITHDGGVTGPN